MIRILSSLLLIVIAGSYLAFTVINPEPIDPEPNPEPEPEDRVMDASLAIYLEEFERNFEDGLNAGGIPGAAVTIVKAGEVLFQKGFGVREMGAPGEVDKHTVFRLGSVSKGFASVLTGVFVEEGVVNWDQPVSNYVEEFRLHDPEQTGRVQIKHLLSHTSGLPRHAYTNLVEDGLSLDRIIPRLVNVPLIAEEGTQLSYQNAAYSMIEKVLELQTGTDFNTLLDEKLFTPLAMNHSSISYDGILNSENVALPHVYHSRSRG